MIYSSPITNSVPNVPPVVLGLEAIQTENHGKLSQIYRNKGYLETKSTTCGVIVWHNMNGRMVAPLFLIQRYYYLNGGQFFLDTHLLTKSYAIWMKTSTCPWGIPPWLATSMTD